MSVTTCIIKIATIALIIVGKNVAIAEENLREASVINNQGSMYYHGRGVKQDRDKACQLFQEAALLGDKYAKFNFANCYSRGEHFQQDYDLALEWYKKSYDLGYEQALVSLAMLIFIDSPRQNEMQWAFDELLKLDTDKRALFIVGVIYSKGLVGEVSFDKSLEYYEKAAYSGNVLAAAILSHIYEIGLYNQNMSTLKSNYWKAIFHTLNLMNSDGSGKRSKAIEYLKKKKLGLE